MKILILLFLGVSLFSSPVTLVWQVDKKGIWEGDWILEMLSTIEFEEVEDYKFEKFCDRSIVVISAHQEENKYLPYLEELHKKGYRFGVILLGDEYYQDSGSFYPFAEFIFRNYWHKKFQGDEKVVFFPLGYKRGFWEGSQNEPSTVLERAFTWSYAGRINNRPTREEMVQVLKEIPHFHLHEIHYWADPKSLNAAEYRDLLLNTIFVPCPRGDWNLDSFRVYEALECGCIPIVEKGPLDYFEKAFGDHPFLVVENWKDAPKILESFLLNPSGLEKKRVECQEFWQKLKKEKKEEMKAKIEGAFK